MKIGNGYDIVLNRRMRDFINEVEHIKSNGVVSALRDEKISAASKQLQYTLNKS